MTRVAPSVLIQRLDDGSVVVLDESTGAEVVIPYAALSAAANLLTWWSEQMPEDPSPRPRR